MRLVFMGTPEFSTHALKALIAAGHEVVCVYAQPPRPKGRGLDVQKQPVHVLAESLGIEVRTPLSLKSVEEQERFVALKADAAVVVAYGLLLPKPILDGPKFGCFNIHASLLPRWRGAAPIQRAIMAGDAETGVCIMRMEIGLDTGPVVLMEALPITPETTAASLHDELAGLSSRLIVSALMKPSAHGAIQHIEGVTYAKKIEKAEAHINFDLSAEHVRNHIHGLSPFPGAWCMINGARVKLLNVEVVGGKRGAMPDSSIITLPPLGEGARRADEGLVAGPIGDDLPRDKSLIRPLGTFSRREKGEAETRQFIAGFALDDRLTFACASGAITILKLQREGKGPMDAETFLRGFPVPAGTKAS